jgi:hypothetical protein
MSWIYLGVKCVFLVWLNMYYVMDLKKILQKSRNTINVLACLNILFYWHRVNGSETRLIIAGLLYNLFLNYFVWYFQWLKFLYQIEKPLLLYFYCHCILSRGVLISIARKYMEENTSSKRALLYSRFCSRTRLFVGNTTCKVRLMRIDEP